MKKRKRLMRAVAGIVAALLIWAEPSKEVEASQIHPSVYIFYVDQDGNSVASAYYKNPVTNKELKNLSVKSPSISGYALVNSSDSTVTYSDLGFASFGDRLMTRYSYTVVYQKKSTVTIRFINADFQQLKPDVVLSGIPGHSFYYSSPSITGYTANVSSVSGTYGNSGKLATILYSRKTYTISYSSSLGNAPSSQTKKYDESIKLAGRMYYTGYSFLGWGTSSSATSASYKANETFTGNYSLSLYAVWQQDKYTISYDANGGSGAPSNQTKYGGQSIQLSSVRPTRAGYTFKGWGIAPNNVVYYNPGATYYNNSSLHLYAAWEKNPDPTPTNTPTPKPTNTPTPKPTSTPTPKPTATPTPTNTPRPTSTPAPSKTYFTVTCTDYLDGSYLDSHTYRAYEGERIVASSDFGSHSGYTLSRDISDYYYSSSTTYYYRYYVSNTPTSTPRPTNTPTPTPKPTSTPKPTATSTPRPTNTPTPTSTPRPTSTPTPRPTNTPTPRPTNTPVPTNTPTPVIDLICVEKAESRNSTYHAGETVITSYEVMNDSLYDITPGDGVSFFFEVYYIKNGMKEGVDREGRQVVIPKGEKNLIYIKWTVPEELSGVTLYVTGKLNNTHTVSETGYENNNVVRNTVVQSKPVLKTENPAYSDKKPDGFTTQNALGADVPITKWEEWAFENGAFVKKKYAVYLETSSAVITPDDNSGAAKVNGNWNIKSGYGYKISVKTSLSTYSDYLKPMNDAYVEAQYAVVTFPEYGFLNQNRKAATLEKVSNEFSFARNEGIVGKERLHFIPVWYPDGNYTVNVQLSGIWTPIGEVKVTLKSNTFTVNGAMYNDWYYGR